MCKKFALLFLMIFTANAWSQNYNFVLGNSLNTLFITANVLDDPTVTVEGSPYINNKFLSSSLSCLTENTPPMRYNVYKEEMEFVHEGKLYYVKKNDTCVITLLNNSYKYFENYNKEKNSGYLLILNKLNNSKYILYKKEKVVLIPEFIPSSSYGEAKPATYAIENPIYFISIQDKLVEFPKKKSDLFLLFPNNKQAIESFLKDKKISFNEESKIVELVDFLNSL
jgi:hypothetical protein